METAEKIIKNVNGILYNGAMSYYQYKEGSDLYVILNGPELFSNSMLSPVGSINRIIFVFYTDDYKSKISELLKIDKKKIYTGPGPRSYNCLQIFLILLVVALLVGLLIYTLKNC